MHRIETPQRSLLRKRLAAMVAALPLLGGGAAIADSAFTESGAGVFVGYSFESDKVNWGIEAFSREYNDCQGCGVKRKYMGPALRLSFLGTQPTVSLGMAVGSDLHEDYDPISLGLEIGVGLSFANQFSVQLETGVLAEQENANLYARHSWGKQELRLGVGVRTPNIEGMAVDGRPYRDGTGLAQPSWSPMSENCSETGKLWQSRAQEECASAPAFLQLAAELLSLGAPDLLVEKALEAAADEIRHTQLATSLAHRYGAIQTQPVFPSFSVRPALNRKAQLTRLATESWLDGCLGEAAAAAIATAEASQVCDTKVRAVQKTIAKDEESHAALAREVLRWVLVEDSSIAKPVKEEKLREFSAKSMLPAEDQSSVLHHSSARERDFLATIV